MSASSKKKLRNAQETEKLTQRQQAEQKEAKKIKRMTIGFTAVLVLMVVFLVGYVVSNAITKSGTFQKSTIAAKVGSHELNSVEMNYFYVDTINSLYSDSSSYISYFITSGVALDQQNCAFTDGTWADYFLDSAMSGAASTYALYDAAVAAGYTLSEEAQTSINNTVQTQTIAAKYTYGYSDLDSFLSAMYGPGANEESYTAYLTVSTLANNYYNDYVDALTYTEEELRAADDSDPLAYNSYSYCYYYLPVSDFCEGGTTDESGNVTYSDEELAAGEAAAKEAAESLLVEAVTDQESFNVVINRIKSDASCTNCAYYPYSSVLNVAKEWLTDSGRTAGDKTIVENTTDDTLKGYYVVLYNGMTDNTTEMIDVRHILIAPEDTSSDQSWAAALEEAESLLNEWKSGDATEDSFATLANANSDDTGSNTTGGLYENVYFGQMVEEFSDWCFDSSRKTGDTGIVKSEHGYHIMYFVGAVGQNYRDYKIEQTLLNLDVTEWYTALTENYASELKETKYILTDLTLS